MEMLRMTVKVRLMGLVRVKRTTKGSGTAMPSLMVKVMANQMRLDSETPRVTMTGSQMNLGLEMESSMQMVTTTENLKQMVTAKLRG